MLVLDKEAHTPKSLKAMQNLKRREIYDRFIYSDNPLLEIQ